MSELAVGTLALLLVGLGWWTVAARDAFAAVVGFLAYGLLLTLGWVLLHGVDVALTEAAIGGGLTGALLIGAVARLARTQRSVAADVAPGGQRLLAAALAAAVTLALIACVVTLPDPAPSLAQESMARIAPTGVGNPITAVLLAYRSMDTLLEAIVLVLALLGVWSLSPDGVWGGRPGPLHRADPDGVLAYLARLLPPIGVLIGLYIFWIGADAPGGKFQGATLIAAMWLLVVMAGLADFPPISRHWVRVGIVAGPLVFVAIGLAGAAYAGAFLAYPDGLAKPLIIVIELALMPSLTLILALLLAGAPLRPPSP
ncbi:MAG: hydrogenase subunit MbhD domain-containing protein [Burkholderiales bacterium]